MFQALRIAVNSELSAIEKSTRDAFEYLARGGRIIAISFHSLEDRIIKNRFKRIERGCRCKEDSQFCQCERRMNAKIITKKPITPDQDEISVNKRARSAKLRVCERL